MSAPAPVDALPPLSRRDRLAALLSSREAFLAVALVTLVLTWFGGAGFLLGLAVALLTLWARRGDRAWLAWGPARPGRDLLRGAGYALAIFVLVDVVAQPLLDRWLGAKPDVSQFAFLRGNVVNLLLVLLFMWIVAAVGEEVFFRGYLMRGWARFFGDGRRAWILGAVLSTIPFGIAHRYQGTAGVLNTALVGAIIAVQLYRGRDRLVSCMATHGLYDTLGLTLIFLGKEDLPARLLY